jgi:MFS transporter, Spinster family, sphingosine-1-phosphate transporter
MVSGLHRDMRVIIGIPTLRFALVGVSTVGFVVTAVGTWMPSFYQNQLGLTQGQATGIFGLLLVLGGIPGTIWGGWVADRWVNRVVGARVVIPAVCMLVSASLFVLSFAPHISHGLVFFFQLLGLLAATASVPALRAGLSDASPAQVRGAGFAAFNLASVVFGAAAAPLVTAAVASQFDNDYRTAFLIVMPIAFVGAAFLLLARRHIEKDSAKVFEAVAQAMAANEAEEAAYASAEAGVRRDGARQDEVEELDGDDGET